MVDRNKTKYAATIDNQKDTNTYMYNTKSLAIDETSYQALKRAYM